MLWLATAVVFLPFAIACICFLVSLVFFVRALRHTQPKHELIGALVAPLFALSPWFYTPTGVRLLNQFKRWFRMFTTWLVVFGVVALALGGAAKLLSSS